MKACDWDAFPLYKKLIGPLREVARRLGYALAVHGTLKRDIDLIACPWTRQTVGAKVLANAIRAKAREVVGFAEPSPHERAKWFRDGVTGFAQGFGRVSSKPHGRRCWTFHLVPTYDGPYLDVSIMPRLKESW
jgi:hypothetical protein